VYIPVAVGDSQVVQEEEDSWGRDSSSMMGGEVLVQVV